MATITYGFYRREDNKNYSAELYAWKKKVNELYAQDAHISRFPTKPRPDYKFVVHSFESINGIMDTVVSATSIKSAYEESLTQYEF